MTNLSDEIISIFLNKKVLILKDSEISLSLIAQGIQCYTEEVRRHVQSLSPALFQLSFNQDSTITIRADPKVDICGSFLAGRCHNNTKQCGRLHLCREFGHCTIRDCRYPHDFNRGENRKIIEQINCQDINPQLLVQLIRLKKSLTHSESYPNTHKSRIYHKELPKQDDINRQIDISYPSVNLAQQIDMEIIEMILNTDGIKIEKKLNECENEYFRRGTIQLEQINDVEKLLSSPILHRGDFDIKLKRTKQLIDRSSFKLKTSINNTQDKITENRVRLYVSLLIKNINSFTINDLSTMNEQIFFIQSNNDIDFDQVHQQYESKRQLQNKDISLIQIYECDTVNIRYIDENKLMTYDDMERIISSVRKYVFTFELTDKNSVEIEFINADAYKQWMSIIDKIQAKFRVIVTPVITDLDDSETIPFNINPSFINKPYTTTIKLRSEWTIVAAHPVFNLEYKDYIREQLGGEIEIHGDEVTYTGNFPQLPRCPTNESILTNKTNNYMQKLKYQTLHDLKPHQINILRTNLNTIAFTRLHKNDYLVAAKYQDMFDLKSKLFPKRNQPNHAYSLMDLHLDDREINHSPTNKTFDNIYRSPPTPLLQQETIERSSLPNAPLVSSIFPVTTSEQMSMFSINTFEDRLQQYLKEIFNVKIIIERTIINDKIKGEKSRIIIKISGQTKDVENAIEDLMNLFSSLRTRQFDDKTDGNWTKSEEATQIIQHHFTQNDFISTCQKISPTVVHVNYFDITNPQFGIDEQKIEDLINNQFSLATITYNQQSISSKFTKEWTDLEDKIRKRDDYKKDICLYNEINAIYLFGLTKLVKEFRQAFEQIKNKHIPQICKIKLSEKQINYLTRVVKNDLNKLEKKYKTDGCDLSLIRLRQHGDFIAPPDMHSEIKESLEALAEIDEITFEIKNTAFEVLINKEPQRLFSLVKSKCYLEKQVQTHRTSISVPKAQIADPEDLPQQSHTASAMNSTSINIGNSTITIAIGDLTAQAVDTIVVCSTSEILRKAVIAQAGPKVQDEYDEKNSNAQQASVTSNGALPCKKILFLPWKVNPTDPSSLKTSLSTFVTTAIKYTSTHGYKTLAFPSVGCGKFGFDPSIIAKYMIDETQTQLKSINSKMDVSFILLSNQQNVYDEFVKYLNTTQTVPAVISKIPSTNKTNNQLKIPYDEKIIQITLISANNSHLRKCKNDILELSDSSSLTKRLTDKHDMIDWSQNTINQYYTYCLKQHVIPTLDFDTCTLELVGPKDAVHEAEKYFYELTTETFKQARIHAVSQGVIWSVEITPDSNSWEQYSYKLNGIIEDASLKKLPQMDFVNDKQEPCRIVFNLMEEQHETGTRRIRRKVVDSLLPDEWETSDQNCIRVTLQASSKEYQAILQRFNTTMIGQYHQIIKIERIQNERWYKQYAAHRDEYKRRYGKLDERLLFHGCLDTSANQIIQECFNRSFAGVNGVVYGHGVYFHSNAVYSHSYAKPSGSGERTMFLARVLIGKTCAGNKTMKVPPSGYDTTSDGSNIFVVYHDAGAYADHLITYK